MIILPAIDIRNGTCVRLLKGAFETAEKVAEDPLDTAFSFQKAGAEWIHMVDLDGALKGERTNSKIFVSVAAETDLKVEIGGGIRRIQDIEYYLDNGIERVILGSIAVKEPDFVKEAVKNFGSHIAVGIDARNGMVAAEGWTETSSVNYIELAKRMEEAGVKYIIYTDIDKDGTLLGPNTKQLIDLNNAVTCNIIASGGINDIDDITQLRASQLYGAICGKSIYKGTLSLKEAIQSCK